MLTLSQLFYVGFVLKTISHKLNIIKALLALFAAFLICAGQSGDFALCFNAYGHIAVETLINGQCECERRTNDHEGHYLSLQDAFESHRNHDHNHFDISIFMDNVGEYKFKDEYKIQYNNTSSLYHIPVEISFYDGIFFEVYIIEPPPCVNPTLVSIRSVILLS